MTPLLLIAASFTAMAAAAAVTIVAPPPRRLSGRVKPYVVTENPELGRAVHPISSRGWWWRILAPLVHDAAEWLASHRRSDGGIGRRLRWSGLYSGLTESAALEAHRVSTALRAMGLALLLGTFGLAFAGLAGAVLFGCLGGATGYLTSRSRLDRAVTARRTRMRSELYTINQLLALRARAGGGIAAALRHVVERANGAVVDELAEVLRMHRSGWGMRDALLRAADLTAEPEAGRTYRVLATTHERGGDIADALLSLSRDLRQARRRELKERAARRRLLLVLPLVVILAPVVLLFVAAPLPSLIFGP